MTSKKIMGSSAEDGTGWEHGNLETVNFQYWWYFGKLNFAILENLLKTIISFQRVSCPFTRFWDNSHDTEWLTLCTRIVGNFRANNYSCFLRCEKKSDAIKKVAKLFFFIKSDRVWIWVEFELRLRWCLLGRDCCTYCGRRKLRVRALKAAWNWKLVFMRRRISLYERAVDPNILSPLGTSRSNGHKPQTTILQSLQILEYGPACSLRPTPDKVWILFSPCSMQKPM